MKFTFEVDSKNIKDVLDAIQILNSFSGNDYISSNIIEYKEETPNLLDESREEEVSLKYETKITELESEITRLKEEIVNYESSLNSVNEESIVPDVSEFFPENEVSSEEVEKLKAEIESLKEENLSLKESKTESVDLSLYLEKTAHESVVSKLNSEIEYHKNRSEKNFQKNKDLRNSIDNLAKHNKELESKLASYENNLNQSSEDIEELKCTIEKLQEEVAYHKGRSDKNWESLNSLKSELKNIKAENAELSEKLKEKEDNFNNVNIEEVKSELVEQKNKYEAQIGELKLMYDKAQNELAFINSKYNENDSRELEELRVMKTIICSNEKGKVFWRGIQAQAKTKTNL